jgi:hypothetical protein
LFHPKTETFGNEEDEQRIESECGDDNESDSISILNSTFKISTQPGPLFRNINFTTLYSPSNSCSLKFSQIEEDDHKNDCGNCVIDNVDNIDDDDDDDDDDDNDDDDDDDDDDDGNNTDDEDDKHGMRRNVGS